MIHSNSILKHRRVLIVDDQEINRDVLGMILEDGYETLFATNGQEALDCIRQNDYDISLLLLDLMMPVMDGFEVMERMKKDPLMQAIPVIVLTSEKSAELKALQLGAADFITKPFDLAEVILARAERVIELCEGKELISSAEHDSLTGLYTRNFFYEYVNRLYLYHPEQKMDALSLNMEKFHMINELYGREFGDEVIRVIGKAILSFLSETQGIAGRFEADTFEIWCMHRDDYAPLLETVLASLRDSFPKISLHVRIGVMPFDGATEPLLMFDRARTACNRARGDYQNPLVVYDEKLKKKEHLQQQLIHDLQAAVEEKQFQVYYQPKYNIQCDPPKLCSAEALIRWKHPELGMISPGEFIPLFEENGMIHVVDKFVWKEAAAQLSRWDETYPTLPLSVSVNLSRSEMFDSTLVQQLVDLVKENHLDFPRFKLEVTESAYTDDEKQLLDVVSRLRNAGFEVEMDDFGSGYSSLNMLSSMPIDVLKMDMKFVRNIETNPTDRKLITLILDIARKLKTPVVAEGVENEAQLAFLKQEKCDLVQGYYFSRPVPAEEFEKLILKELQIKRNEP